MYSHVIFMAHTIRNANYKEKTAICSTCGLVKIRKCPNPKYKNGKVLKVYDRWRCTKMELFQHQKYRKTRKVKSPEDHMVANLRPNARRSGIIFKITGEDISVPKHCPILNIELSFNGKMNCRPSIDRIIPELGYVPGNVRVISFAANRMKSNNTIETLERLIAYIKGEI